MQDFKNTIEVGRSIGPAAYIATVTGVGVDTMNSSQVVVILDPGTITDGTHTPSIQESDDNTTFTAVAAVDLIGVPAALASNVIQKIGYMGRKRYIRALVTVAGATTGGIYSAKVLGTMLRRGPV